MNAAHQTIAVVAKAVSRCVLGGTYRGAYFDNDLLGEFLNEGTISSTSDYAVGFDTDVGTFTNKGTISGQTDGVQFDNAVTTFTNAKGATISGTDGEGVSFSSTVDSFTNAGTIKGFGENNAAHFGGAVTSFLNSGTMDSDYGTNFNSTVGSFSNTGTINATRGKAVSLNSTVGSFSNTGTISGTTWNGMDGIGVYADGPDTIITNAGRISGDAYSVYFYGANGTLKLLTGGTLSGKAHMGGGTLDVSGYRGSAIIDVENLPDGNVIAGNNLYAQTTDKVVVVGDTAAVTGSGQQVSSVTAGIGGLVTSQLDFEGMGGGGGDDGGPLGYAPERTGTAAEQATAKAMVPAGTSGPVIWGNAAAGGSARGIDSSMYGAIVFGSHTSLGDDMIGGVLGGYARSSSRSANSQTITSDTGVLGLYGRGDVGVVTVDVSLLGGASANGSARDVQTGGGVQVATASFGGWFINPSVGFSVPVLSTAEGEFAAVGSVGYLFGGFGGYTETGSGANLTVGPQTIGVLTVSAGLQGKMAIGSNEHGAILGRAKAELFAESNVGTSSVPISVLGTSIGNAVAPNGTAYGLRGNVGVDVPVSENLTVAAGANGSVRTDGYVSAGANLKLSGTL